MVPEIRKLFNRNYSDKAYQNMLRDIDQRYPGALDFKLAETPVFIPKDFGAKMLNACESIIDIITDPEFRSITETSVPAADKVQGEYGYPCTIAFDFGVCLNNKGEYEPQLVEMQGFPSLYAFQSVYPDLLRKHFTIPDNYSQYLSGLNSGSYQKMLQEVLLGGHAPENVILLEIKPHEQKTRIDFYSTEELTGIQPVCITELIQQGKELYYKRNGKKIKISRIYNRIIFDELNSRTDLGKTINIRDDFHVEWVPHPDWFYRISKFTLPVIKHPYVPDTYFLDQVKQLPRSLSDYVLKPLFSFAGQGVIIDIQPEDITKITDPGNWILQKKVNYADVIVTPDGLAKTEIRIMYLWKQNAARPEPVINLARISKGKMIGTRYNKDKSWVGGSVAFFER